MKIPTHANLAIRASSSSSKLAVFCCPFFVNESKKRAGLRKRLLEIDFQLITSLTRMGSFSEYFFCC